LSHRDEVPEMLVVRLLSTLRHVLRHYSHHDVIVDPDEEIDSIRIIYQYVICPLYMCPRHLPA